MFHGTKDAAKARWAERAAEWHVIDADAPRVVTLAQLAALWLTEGRASKLRTATRQQYEGHPAARYSASAGRRAH